MQVNIREFVDDLREAFEAELEASIFEDDGTVNRAFDRAVIAAQSRIISGEQKQLALPIRAGGGGATIELTRGQKAAQTRAKNRKKRDRETAANATTVTPVTYYTARQAVDDAAQAESTGE